MQIVNSDLISFQQMITLHNMVSTGVSSINVARKDGSYESVCVTELVPGDVIVIPPQGCTMTCDAVLMAGTCIVNESMLTGKYHNSCVMYAVNSLI